MSGPGEPGNLGQLMQLRADLRRQLKGLPKTKDRLVHAPLQKTSAIPVALWPAVAQEILRRLTLGWASYPTNIELPKAETGHTKG